MDTEAKRRRATLPDGARVRLRGESVPREPKSQVDVGAPCGARTWLVGRLLECDLPAGHEGQHGAEYLPGHRRTSWLGWAA